MLKDFLDQELSESADIRFAYTPAIKSFMELYSFLHGLQDVEFSFIMRGKEIEVYEEQSFLGSIKDLGSAYLVPQKLLKTPAINFQLRRMRL